MGAPGRHRTKEIGRGAFTAAALKIKAGRCSCFVREHPQNLLHNREIGYSPPGLFRHAFSGRAAAAFVYVRSIERAVNPNSRNVPAAKVLAAASALSHVDPDPGPHLAT